MSSNIPLTAAIIPFVKSSIPSAGFSAAWKDLRTASCSGHSRYRTNSMIISRESIISPEAHHGYRSKNHHRHRPTRRLDQGSDRSGSLHQRSEEHTSELQSLMRISYAVLCLHKNTNNNINIKQP